MIKAPFAIVIYKPQPMLNKSSYCSSKVMLFIWNNDCKILLLNFEMLCALVYSTVVENNQLFQKLQAKHSANTTAKKLKQRDPMIKIISWRFSYQPLMGFRKHTSSTWSKVNTIAAISSWVWKWWNQWQLCIFGCTYSYIHKSWS